MKLIADSGSTKTTWILLDRDKIRKTITTSGLNPYFHNAESVAAIIKAEIIPYLEEYTVKEVHFYGAGCSTTLNNNMISDAIRNFFRNSSIFIYHDILGAARALFGNDKGIACILGTGSNSCYYDGSSTYSPIDSLGFLFGDEGAGSYLGKLFLHSYLKKELPGDLCDAFDAHYGYTLEDILNSLYNKPFPNKYLASFNLFLSPNRKHPFVHQLLTQSFLDFFDAHIRKYDSYLTTDIGFLGSIAHSYSEILTDIARNEGIKIIRISASPVEGLVEYHKLFNC